MELNEFLNWAIGGVGSGVLAYLMIRYFKLTFSFSGRVVVIDLDTLSPIIKRRLGIFLPGLLAFAAWGLSLAHGYNVAPGTGVEFVEVAFQIILAPVVSLIVHGEVELRKKEVGDQVDPSF